MKTLHDVLDDIESQLVAIQAEYTVEHVELLRLREENEWLRRYIGKDQLAQMEHARRELEACHS